MTDRNQIVAENEPPRRTHQPVAGLIHPDAAPDVAHVFDLGSSGGSDIARNKDSMIAEAFQAAYGDPRKN